MTAEEIRTRWTPGGTQAELMDCLHAEILQEMAAQLSEANGLKRMEMGAEPEPPAGPAVVHIMRSHHEELLKIVEVARNVIKLPPAMEPDCDQEFDHLRLLIEAYDDIPF